MSSIENPITRRNFLRFSGIVIAGALTASCGQSSPDLKVTPTAIPEGKLTINDLSNDFKEFARNPAQKIAFDGEELLLASFLNPKLIDALVPFTCSDGAISHEFVLRLPIVDDQKRVVILPALYVKTAEDGWVETIPVSGKWKLSNGDEVPLVGFSVPDKKNPNNVNRIIFGSDSRTNELYYFSTLNDTQRVVKIPRQEKLNGSKLASQVRAATATPDSSTPTPTPSEAPTVVATATSTQTVEPTATPSPSPTPTETPTPSPTPDQEKAERERLEKIADEFLDFASRTQETLAEVKEEDLYKLLPILEEKWLEKLKKDPVAQKLLNASAMGFASAGLNDKAQYENTHISFSVIRNQSPFDGDISSVLLGIGRVKMKDGTEMVLWGFPFAAKTDYRDYTKKETYPHPITAIFFIAPVDRMKKRTNSIRPQFNRRLFENNQVLGGDGQIYTIGSSGISLDFTTMTDIKNLAPKSPEGDLKELAPFCEIINKEINFRQELIDASRNDRRYPSVNLIEGLRNHVVPVFEIWCQ